MHEPFDIETGETIYSVFPEGDDIYAIFKEGENYLIIQKDTDGQWLKLDPATEMPLFDNDPEVTLIGRAIESYHG